MTKKLLAQSDRGVFLYPGAGWGARSTGVLTGGTLLAIYAGLGFGLVLMLETSSMPACSIITLVDGTVTAGVPEIAGTATLRVTNVSMRAATSALIMSVFRS